MFLFLAIASHGLLDAFTDGGLGVAFFAPFDSTRYFFPVTPIEVSPNWSGILFSTGPTRRLQRDVLGLAPVLNLRERSDSPSQMFFIADERSGSQRRKIGLD